MTPNDGEWLTVNEAAEISGYHPEYIRRLIRDGEIEGRKFAIVWQVRRDSLNAYIQNAQSKDDKRYTPKRIKR
jgi:excisionase family DNA binding protein